MTVIQMTNNLEPTAEKFLQLMNRLRRLGPGIAPPKEAKISPSLLALLEYTSSNPGCGVQTMAEGLSLSTPTVSIAVRQLEKSGFMERQSENMHSLERVQFLECLETCVVQDSLDLKLG